MKHEAGHTCQDFTPVQGKQPTVRNTIPQGIELVFPPTCRSSLRKPQPATAEGERLAIGPPSEPPCHCPRAASFTGALAPPLGLAPSSQLVLMPGPHQLPWWYLRLPGGGAHL